MNTVNGGLFDLQKSLSGTKGFPWAKYPGEYHVPSYSYLGPGTSLSHRLDSNLQPKSGEYPIDAVDTAALAHDIRYLHAEQENSSQEVLDEKHKADAIMIEELSKIDPSCFREKFAKWIAEKALSLKLKMGMKINPLSGKPMDPIYSDAMSNFLIDMEVLNARKAHKNNPTEFPESYVNEITEHAEKLKQILGKSLGSDNGNNDSDVQNLVDKYFTEYKQDVKEYDDHKAEEERKAREVTFIERLIEIIEKPMKFISNYTFGQIPFLKDFMTYDKLKGLITGGSKSKWELREEADALDEAIKSVDSKIDELLKQGHLSYNSDELQKLYEAAAPLRQQRREYKRLLGFGLPVLKGIHHRLVTGGKINSLGQIDPNTNEVSFDRHMDPIYTNSYINFLVDAIAKGADNPEVYKTAEKIKSILGSALVTDETPDEVQNDELLRLYDKYTADYNKNVKDYNDQLINDDRIAREVPFIDKVIDGIEGIVKTAWDSIPVISDLVKFDTIKNFLTGGVPDRRDLRKEAAVLDEAIKVYDEEIDKLQKQGHSYSSNNELKELCDDVSTLRSRRREIKYGTKHHRKLGYSLSVLKGIKNKLAAELHSPIVRKFTRRSVFMNALDEIWSADLVFMPNADNQYKAILTVIDNFSKYAWAIPVKTKKNIEIINAFKTIFESSNRKPKKLWTDKGTEFIGADVKLFLLQNKVEQYSTESELKAVIIERLNRTLKEKMYRKFTEIGDDKDWHTILPIVVDEYNNATHSSHRMSPIEASKPENEVEVKKRLNAKMLKYSSKPPKYKVGDKVRIYSYKYTFDKGYKKNYTEEIFEIHLVHSTVPWTYSIKDSTNEVIVGKFYEYEMIHSDFDFGNKLKVNKVYNF